jgi:hypothetical protein
MQGETLTSPENLERLRQEIFKFTKDKSFKQSKSMGDIMLASFNFVRLHYEKVDMHDLF